MFPAAILAASLVFTPADARLAHTTAGLIVANATPRDAGTRGAFSAANIILNAASAAGADTRIDTFSAPTPKGARYFTNVIAKFEKDPALGWIVFVSHYDTKPGSGCPGANDGASTSGLLVAMCESLKRQEKILACNVMFIWTDGEECIERYSAVDGLWGARRAAQMLKDDRCDVKGVICLDMLGDRDLGVSIPRNTSSYLRKAALAVADATPLKGRVKAISEMIKDDHVPFAEAGFEAVTLIDFEYGSEKGLNDYWHTPEDTMDKISEKSLHEAGSLAMKFLDILPYVDKPSPKRKRKR